MDNTKPPDLTGLLTPDGDLVRSVPVQSRLFDCFYYSNESRRPEFIKQIKDEHGNVASTVFSPTFFEADGTTILPQFLNRRGEFIPVYDDHDQLILFSFSHDQPQKSPELPVLQEISTTLSHISYTCLKKRNTDSIPSLSKWDGNPDTWFAWKRLAESRWRRMQILNPQSQDEEIMLYDEIQTHFKIEDTKHSRRAQAHIEKYTDGSDLWDALTNDYERNNDRVRRQLKNELKHVTIDSFPNHDHTGFYDVQDMFNTIDLKASKLRKTGGDWTDDDYLSLLDDAFQTIKLQRDHYSAFKLSLSPEIYCFNEESFLIGKSSTIHDTIISRYSTSRYRTHFYRKRDHSIYECKFSNEFFLHNGIKCY